MSVNGSAEPPSTQHRHDYIIPSQQGIPIVQQGSFSLKRPARSELCTEQSNLPDASKATQHFPTHFFHENDFDMTEYATSGTFQHSDFGFQSLNLDGDANQQLEVKRAWAEVCLDTVNRLVLISCSKISHGTRSGTGQQMIVRLISTQSCAWKAKVIILELAASTAVMRVHYTNVWTVRLWKCFVVHAW